MSEVKELLKPGEFGTLPWKILIVAAKTFKLLYLLIHVLRSISRHKIHLFGTITVMAQGGVVLKAIARAILVHWLMGNKLRGVWGAYSVCDLHASGQRLPRVIRSLPPASTLEQNMQSIIFNGVYMKQFGWKS